MKLVIILAALATIACATAQEPTSSGGCNADGLRDLLGRDANAALNEEALRRSGARQLRRIRPGDAVTMDFQEDRLNIYVDAQGRVERFQCG